MTENKRFTKIIELIKPHCPHCNADVSYVYYGEDGSKYCPICMKKLRDGWE